MKFNSQVWSPALGRDQPRVTGTLGIDWLESCLAEQDLGILVKLNKNQCALAAIEAKHALGSISSSLIGGTHYLLLISPLNSALVRWHPEPCVQFWAHQ